MSNAKVEDFARSNRKTEVLRQPAGRFMGHSDRVKNESYSKWWHRNWSSVVTITCIIITAVIEALQEGFSHAPKFGISLDGVWNYVPLSLLIIAGLSWVVGRKTRVPAASPPDSRQEDSAEIQSLKAQLI
jgi:hypothetical protein